MHMHFKQTWGGKIFNKIEVVYFQTYCKVDFETSQLH